MLRVLHVVSYFPPDRMGGVGEVVSHVHRALKAGGHLSAVVTTGRSHDDPDVHRIADSPGKFGLASASRASMARDVDVVHMHHGEGLGLLVAMRALGIRTPVLLTLHVGVDVMRRSLGPYSIGGQTFHPESPSSWIYRQLNMRVRWWMDRAASRLADEMSFISRSAAVDVLGVEQGHRAKVVYNGVPALAPHAEVGHEPRLSPVELLFVGANSERKRVELLPLILAAVRRHRPGARLRIVGFNKHESPEIVRLSLELGLQDAIEFAGPVHSGELSSYYRSAAVLVVPSAYEGLPMVILEAMRYGVPVVATRVSGHPEVIEDGINGLLVPVDSPAEMAMATLRLLEEPSLAHRIGAAGRSRAAVRFSIDQQVAGYLVEYERLVAGRRTAR